jgi:crotonobetainyl-CoA:carnitine CoA-transferase CaiB-like acyl-CoA transferase
LSAGALDGLVVVELAHERCAFAGKLLADMGADVIVVERPGGCPTRRHAPFADGDEHPEKSLHWWYYNTSKRGVTLALEREGGRALFEQLLATADILLEGETPGALARLGLDDARIRELAPDLIHTSITPFGRNSERSHEPSTDLTILAGGGPVWSCGYDDHSIPPVRGLGNQGAAIGAHYAVMSILTAVLYRMASGEGQHIDVSQHACANVTTEMASYHWLVQQGTVQRQTGRHALEQPSMESQIRCADGRYVCTGVPPRFPHEFARLHAWVLELGLEEQLPETLFLEMGAQRDFIDLSAIGSDDEITAIFGAGREALALIAANVPAYDFFMGAQRAGLAVGVIYAPEEVLSDPHFVERGFPVEVDHPELGRAFVYPGAPYQFEKTPWQLSRRAPQLGEHNGEVFGVLGLDDAALEKLRADGSV